MSCCHCETYGKEQGRRPNVSEHPKPLRLAICKTYMHFLLHLGGVMELYGTEKKNGQTGWPIVGRRDETCVQ